MTEANTPNNALSKQELAATIDHTLLKPEATPEQIVKVCNEAKEHGFASVCVNAIYTKLVVAELEGTAVKPCVVAGFPLGAMKPMIKGIEATSAAKDGALEIDFVAHLPHLTAKDVEAAKAEYLELTTAVRAVNPDIVVKVIIESAYLMKDVDADEAEARIVTACQAARASGCDFVKTSTGFHGAGGSSVAAVELMRKHAGPMSVKASGGIRSYDDAITMLNAGANRLGCSAGIAIISGQTSNENY